MSFSTLNAITLLNDQCFGLTIFGLMGGVSSDPLKHFSIH